jgi:hypothetical protein
MLSSIRIRPERAIQFNPTNTVHRTAPGIFSECADILLGMSPSDGAGPDRECIFLEEFVIGTPKLFSE